MKRRDLLALALTAPALAAGAATPVARPTPWRIFAVTYRGRTDVERGFADHFAARGIPVEITWRDIALDPARLPGVVDEIRRERPDLVHTWGTGVTLGIAGRWDAPDASRFVRDIPVVFSLVAAPVGAGIVPDVRAPGRPVTGVSHVASLAVQLQAMTNYRPCRALGMLHSPNEPNSAAVLAELQALGRRRGIAVHAAPFRVNAAGQPVADGAAELVRQLRADGAEWLYMPPDSFLSTQARDVVVPAALAQGLPAFASTEQLMSAGALLGLVSRYYSIGQFAAFKAEQILAGKMPASRIQVETLTRFSLQIDLGAARRLGILPPLEMFNYAELIGNARPREVLMTPPPLPPVHALRELTRADLPALLELNRAVVAALSDPGLFRLFGGAEKFLADHLGARGRSLGVFAQDGLVAYGSLTRPAPDDLDNYAVDLGWPPERAGRVALLSAAMVHPAHRVQGLHRALIAGRMALARELGVQELLVRAAPANAVSRRTLLSHGFAVAWLGVQREGSLRHVLWRPVDGPAWSAPASGEPALAWVSAEDHAEQQRLLAEGWLGVRMRPGDPALGFVRAATAGSAGS